MNPNHPPSSDDPCDESKDELAPLQTVARQLMDAIAAEPVSDRLRDLAAELGRALEHQRQERMDRNVTS